ncbi:alternate-type signal peptide domain-containing protein [Gryllotalpicola kribbensis]
MPKTQVIRLTHRKQEHLMNRLFKGAIASAAGVALLLGGAGTFALWQDTAALRNDAAINAGRLEFDLSEYGGHLPYADWEINGHPVVDLPDSEEGTADEIEAVRFVPGDVVTMTWDRVPVIVDGDYLVAKFGVSLENLDFNDMTDAEREAAEAFFADLVHEVQISRDGVNWVSDTNTFELTRGTEVFHVRAQVTFDDDAMDKVAYGARIPLQDIGLSIEQVPHEDHAGYVPPTP